MDDKTPAHDLADAAIGDPTAYLPEKSDWVADQLRAIDAAGDTRAASIQDRSVVVITMRGARSGMLRRVPLMRVEHDGAYLAVASKGGAPENPAWFHNIVKNPDVLVQDGTSQQPLRARMLEEGEERDAWWNRAVEAFPSYADYQTKTDRLIPVFVLEKPAAG
ncbi:nitroreductase family deazaflavin-dependent oxidoreductase [Serinicoccus kebangsaanensis]|uniref:nitroreductase family deazaflavin-dependent oxidoreductase n=1 Tax=Serinicoccus kebangsaanensis TaxID=2602069 RepID=UPI00124DF406|nr:nitroreductase family deazaflavin-dependent oxidoreductase [Serinicoccus kebangsaanensis]